MATGIEGLAGKLESVVLPTITTVVEVKQVSVSSSLASGITAAAAPLANALNGIANIGPINLPLPNPLHKYASYNYIFTLFCLDTSGYNDPDSTYMKGRGQYPIILRGGGGAPDNRFKTDVGKFDFFMDNLEIKATYGFNRVTGNSHATDVKFMVYEPYSIGVFMLTLQEAAYARGYPNYASANYCLVIDFKGEDQSGSMSTIPNTQKFLTIYFDTIDMEVDGSGARYSCVAKVSSESALVHSNIKLTSEITFVGKTVQEILQSGPDSLTAIYNRRLAQVAQDHDNAKPDEILILFPTDISTSAASGGTTTANSDSPTAPPPTSSGNDGLNLNKLGATRQNNALIQTSAVNELGKSTLGLSPSRESLSSSKGAKIYDEKSKQWDQSAINKDFTEGVFEINQESTLINAINQVLLSSDYAGKLLSKDPDKYGMRTMWNIIPSVYHVDTKVNLNKTGTKPRLIVYNVVPYGTLATNLPVPGGGIDKSKYTELLNQCPKAYDYIYTGKNTDILKLDLKFNNNFKAQFANDNYKRGQGTELNTAALKEQKLDIAFSDGITSNDPAKGINNILSFAGVRTATDGKGSGGPDTEAHRAARHYFDAMMYGADLAEISMDIVGDPFWLSSSGSGNYRAKETRYININSDMSVNIHNSEVDFVIRFRNPSDINSTTGLYNMDGSKALLQYSGIYKVNAVHHFFKDGQFYQTLIAKKRVINPSDTATTVVNTKKQTVRGNDASAASSMPPPTTQSA